MTLAYASLSYPDESLLLIAEIYSSLYPAPAAACITFWISSGEMKQAPLRHIHTPHFASQAQSSMVTGFPNPPSNPPHLRHASIKAPTTNSAMKPYNAYCIGKLVNYHLQLKLP